MGILSARDADVYDVMVLDSATFAATVGLGAYLPLNDLLNEKGKELLAGTDDALWRTPPLTDRSGAFPSLFPMKTTLPVCVSVRTC